MIPCSYWALTCCAALPSCKTLYVISVRQTRDLPVVSLFPHPASFRFHLTMDTLAFGYILPTTRRIRDLHPLETCAAGRTQKMGNTDSSVFPIFFVIVQFFHRYISSIVTIQYLHSYEQSSWQTREDYTLTYSAQLSVMTNGSFNISKYSIRILSYFFAVSLSGVRISGCI